MFSPLLNILFEYGGAVLAGIVAGLLTKVFFASQTHKKIKGYQGEIVKSHAKILELEASNGKLEKRLKEVEKAFSKEQLIYN
jgi:hypothetical protein